MKRYIKSSSEYKQFSQYYSVVVDDTGNRYQVRASGSVEDNSLKLQIGRAESNGKKTYGYGMFGYTAPSVLEVYYQGKLQTRKEFLLFEDTNYTRDEYLDEIAYEATVLVDQVNESME